MSDIGEIAKDVAPFIPLGVKLVEAGVRAIKGETSKEQAARDTLDALLEELPREQLIAFLTPEGIAAGELAADIAERAKFGGG